MEQTLDDWMKDQRHLNAEGIPNKPGRDRFATNRMWRTQEKEKTKPTIPDNLAPRPSDRVSQQTFEEGGDIEIIGGDTTIIPIKKRLCDNRPPFLNQQLYANLETFGVIEFRRVQRYMISIMKEYENDDNIKKRNLCDDAMNKDIVVCAPPRCGKTWGYMIPIIDYCTKKNLNLENSDRLSKRQPSVVIIFNSGDGAENAFKNISKLAYKTKIIVCSAIGIIDCTSEKQALNETGADIIVASVGRLRGLIEEEIITLRSMNILVLDDARRLADNPDWTITKEKILNNEKTRKFCTICVSSGFDYGTTMHGLQGVLNPDHCFYLDSKNISPFPKSIQQKLFDCSTSERYTKCLDILMKYSIDKKRYPKTLIFVNQAHTAEWLADRLRLNKKFRLNNFKANVMTFTYDTPNEKHSLAYGMFNTSIQENIGGIEVDVLVATDILSTNVTIKPAIVINFDFPISVTTYHDRVGRLLESKKDGLKIAYTFLNVEEIGKKPMRIQDNIVNVLKVMDHVGVSLPLTAQYYIDRDELRELQLNA